MKKILPKNSLVISLAAMVTACSPVIHHQGKLPEPEAIKKISTGRHTKEDVERILGSPSTVSTFDDKTWYYIAKTTETVSFLTPEVLDQKAVAIYFDDAGYVKEVAQRTLGDAQEVDYVERVTPTSGHSMSFLQQVFGDFGRINRQDK